MGTRYHINSTGILIAVVLCLSMIGLNRIPNTSAARLETLPSITVLTPGGASTDIVGEGDDYFTQVLGQPRTMHHASDLMWQEFGVSNISVGNGMWTGTATNPSPLYSRVWPLYPGFTQGQVAEIGKIGWNYPVQTNKYTQLSFRVNAPNSGQWSIGYTTISNTQPAGFVYGNYSAGWQVYTLNMLTAATNWSSNPIYGLSYAFGAAGTYQVNWIRLTNPSTSPAYTIQFAVSNVQAGDLVDLACYTSTQVSNSSYCGAIASGISVNSPGTYSYVWHTTYLPPGSYYVQATIRRGNVSALSVGPLTIQAAPILHIDAPSMTSGPDYATTELGSPWNMSSSSVLKTGVGWSTTHDVQAPCPCFSNGEMEGTTGRLDPNDPSQMSDPNTYLNVSLTHPIDTSIYKYLTFNYKIDRTPWWDNSPDRLAFDPNRGVYPAAWVARMEFFSQPDPNAQTNMNMLNDIIVFDDENTYQLDLSKGVQRAYWEPDPGQNPDPSFWTGLKYWLRFDFLEGVDPWTFHLGPILLTGDDTANNSYTVKWSQLAGSRPTAINFYTSQNPATCFAGSSIYLWPSSPSQPPGINAGPYKVYLPMIQSSNSLTGFFWDTSNVPNGSYYICAQVADGYNTARTISETPVIISH